MPAPKRRAGAPDAAKRTRISVKLTAALACLGLVALASGLAAYVFFTREPVVLVTDSPFTLLYGQRRGLADQAVLSLKLFRPVKAVSVTADAGPDMVALAAADASNRPFAVFFPYRYYEGASRYAGDHPGARTAVFAGRENMPAGWPPDAPPAAWFSTDTLTDFYRAGYCAGALAAPESRLRQAFEEGRRTILVFQDTFSGVERREEVFLLGLEAYRADISGPLAGVTGQAGAPFPGIPQFAGEDWDFSGRDNPDDVAKLACAVIFGKDGVFFQEHLAIPLIIFSWLDPAFLPDETVLLFDDSPWALIPQALAMLEAGQRGGAIPSAVRGGTLARPADQAGIAGQFFAPFFSRRSRVLPEKVVARIKTLNLPQNTANN